jgi:membrane-associated phospholipid phosphatase
MRTVAIGVVLLSAASPALAQATASSRGGLHGFARDVWSDYRNFVSLDNMQTAVLGGSMAGIISSTDEMVRESNAAPTPYALKPGATYGNVTLQLPIAIGWWITGRAIGSAGAAAAGRDLVRAQISAVSWTYVVKYAADRTRPNGDPRSFPSGHASSTFATATVLQRHYGWKVGLPAFAAATYTGVERITNNKHWASDVAFGATIGVLSGQTVTLHVRQSRVQVRPQPLPGGAGVLVDVLH